MALRVRPHLRTQLREVAAHGELPAVLVDDLEVHEQVRRQGLELEVGRLQRNLGLLAHVGNQPLDEPARA